jgi:hypothetical protein
MPPVQFNSYAGGPHGLGPTVLPERKSILGDIGSMLNQVGQILAQMQQANIKYQLNNLLMNALTQPQLLLNKYLLNKVVKYHYQVVLWVLSF